MMITTTELENSKCDIPLSEFYKIL